MKSKKIWIVNQKGFKLAAYLDLPDNEEPEKYAVFAHCFTCSKDLKSIANIDESLTNFGIGVLRFDMTGIGESEGDFSDTNFTTQTEDFISAAEYLKLNYQPPALAIGHSMGGCVAIEAALRLPDIKAVVTIGTPAEPSNISVKLKNTKARSIRDGTGTTEIGGVKFQFKPQFWKDIESYHLKGDLPGLNRPILILHSPVDSYTPYENGEELYRIANEPKKFISLDNIDHLMLKKSDAKRVGKIISEWVSSLSP